MDSGVAKPQSADVIGPRALIQSRVEGPRCEDWSRPRASNGPPSEASRPRREDQARLGEASTRPQSEASRPGIEDGSRLPAGTELWAMVRPLTVVNSQWKAREVERITPTRSGQSAGYSCTKVPATGGPHVPLTVHVGSADHMRSVQQAVLHAVSSLQMVDRSNTPGVPGRPPPGLAVVSQVEAISNAVMAQMSG